MNIKRESESWIPKQTSIELYESVTSNMTSNDERLDGWLQQYIKSQKKRLTLDLEHTEKYISKNHKILEFGSLPPILTDCLSRCGYDITGLDLDPTRFQSYIDNHQLKIETCDFETSRIPFEGDSFDAVIFNEVFEHLRINPIATFREIKRVLKKGGTLMLSTPNLISWKGLYHILVKGRMAPDIYTEFHKLEALGHMGHIRLYSPLEVVNFLNRMGFQTQVIIHRGEWQSPSPFKKSLGDKFLKIFPKLRTSFSVVAVLK